MLLTSFSKHSRPLKKNNNNNEATSRHLISTERDLLSLFTTHWTGSSSPQPRRLPWGARVGGGLLAPPPNAAARSDDANFYKGTPEQLTVFSVSLGTLFSRSSWMGFHFIHRRSFKRANDKHWHYYWQISSNNCSITLQYDTWYKGACCFYRLFMWAGRHNDYLLVIEVLINNHL